MLTLYLINVISHQTSKPPQLFAVLTVHVAGALHAEHLGGDALHQNVLDCWTGWDRWVQITNLERNVILIVSEE